MKILNIVLPSLAIGLAAVAGGASTTLAQMNDAHTIVTPEQIEWAPGPPSIPPGAQATVLHGDPSEEGVFALRLKMPGDYHIPPHTHGQPEIVTVISGTFRLGMGETADRNAAQALPAGSFFAVPPGMEHYAFTDEDTVIQINSTGPWDLTYVNPEDDPRKRAN